MIPKFERITLRPPVMQAAQITEENYEQIMSQFPDLVMTQDVMGKRFYNARQQERVVRLGGWLLIAYDAFPVGGWPQYAERFTLVPDDELRHTYVVLPDDGDVEETVAKLYHPMHVKPRVSEGLTTTATDDTLQESSS